MGKRWIQSLERRQVEPYALKKEQVGSVDEIAHSLAGNFRFTRQSLGRLPVAQHCVMGARLLPTAFAAAFLVHELSETYLPDIAGPIKEDTFARIRDVSGFLSNELATMTQFGDAWIVPWRTLERQHMRTMLDALGIQSIEPLVYAPEIKAMDRAMLAAEKRDLMGEPPEPWDEDKEGIVPAPVTVTVWSVDAAKTEFVDMFFRYFKR